MAPRSGMTAPPIGIARQLAADPWARSSAHGSRGGGASPPAPAPNLVVRLRGRADEAAGLRDVALDAELRHQREYPPPRRIQLAIDAGRELAPWDALPTVVKALLRCDRALALWRDAPWPASPPPAPAPPARRAPDATPRPGTRAEPTMGHRPRWWWSPCSPVSVARGPTSAGARRNRRRTGRMESWMGGWT
jgi:hypothetical protein